MKLADDKTTLQAFNTNLGKVIKKFDVLSIIEDQKMLAQSISQPTSPFELNLKFGYFCILNFCIRGCSKLCNVDFDESTLLFLSISLVFNFC